MIETKLDKIKRFFLWVFVLIGLVLTIIGSIQLLNLGLKQFVFTKANDVECRRWIEEPRILDKSAPVPTFEEDELCEERQEAKKQKDAALATAFLIVGTPVFFGFYRKAKDL